VFCTLQILILFPVDSQARIAHGAEEGGVRCPCCQRNLESEEDAARFMETMNFFMKESEFVKFDEAEANRYREIKATYQRWKKIVSDNMDDLRDFRRITIEVSDLEKELQTLDDDVTRNKTKLDREKDRATEIQTEVDQLRELGNLAKRWSEDAGRIAEKRMQITQKYSDLNASAVDDGRRDLRSVEKDIDARTEEKDSLSNRISKLNKEMATLNNKISALSTQVFISMNDRGRAIVVSTSF